VHGRGYAPYNTPGPQSVVTSLFCGGGNKEGFMAPRLVPSVQHILPCRSAMFLGVRVIAYRGHEERLCQFHTIG
jgi:hypothetical protein